MTYSNATIVKIAYNTCFGGFALSDAALALAQALSGNCACARCRAARVIALKNTMAASALSFATSNAGSRRNRAGLLSVFLLSNPNP
jgi:hypothetical protein